jgi:phage baseplate assembly protein V
VSAIRDTAELERTRANLVQLGTVAEADYSAARVRVKLGELVSAWLPWTSSRAGGDRTWSAPEVGEQVCVLCPDGDPAGGVVLGAIFSAANGAPANAATVARTTYADGAVIEYDRGAHRLTANLPAGATINLVSDGGITIDASDGGCYLTGALTVTGLVTCLGGLVVQGGTGSTATFTGDLNIIGDVDVTGEITSTGDQVADGISQTGHVHGGVQPGGGNTDVPQ